MSILCPYKNYDGYKYSLKLQLTIGSNESYVNRGKILKAIAALITARLVHKYPVWKVISTTIFITILDELTLQLPLFISSLLWKTKIDIKVYKLDVPLELGMPIIYDMFNYSGSLTPLEANESSQYFSKPVELTYSMAFYISPAIKSALPFYKSEGYSEKEEGITASTLIYYIQFLNRIKPDHEYDHLTEWRNIVELTDYQNELTNKVDVIKKLKELKHTIETTVKTNDKK